ncbi:hypothetical protein HanIR_Chr09g0427081 [Helianthus annuus]|nr:hypothetical protein HanIR_Chr09g0427081 [Helianthus annuus]
MTYLFLRLHGLLSYDHCYEHRAHKSGNSDLWLSRILQQGAYMVVDLLLVEWRNICY